MQRKLFNVAVVLSMALSAAAVFMWIRSYFAIDSYSYRRVNQIETSINSGCGQIYRSEFMREPGSLGGMQIIHDGIPYWMILVVTGLLPVMSLRRHRINQGRERTPECTTTASRT